MLSVMLAVPQGSSSMLQNKTGSLHDASEGILYMFMHFYDFTLPWKYKCDFMYPCICLCHTLWLSLTHIRCCPTFVHVQVTQSRESSKRIHEHLDGTLLTLTGVTCFLMCVQVADSASAVFGGAAFDLLHLNARQVSSIMLGVTLAPAVVWTGYAWWQSKLMSQEAQKGGAKTGADAAAI